MDIERTVSVRVLFFALSKDLAGTKEATIQLPPKISYRQLLETITLNFNLVLIKGNILLAKNEEVLQENIDIELKDCDSIAVIPPLSGG